MKVVYIIETRSAGERWKYDRASPTLKRAREVVRNQREFWNRDARITKFVPVAGEPRTIRAAFEARTTAPTSGQNKGSAT